MSIKNKMKQKYLRFLISTRNNISEFLSSQRMVVDETKDTGVIPKHYTGIMYSTRRKLVMENLDSLRSDIGSTYARNNGLLNEDQLSLLCLYKRELSMIS